MQDNPDRFVGVMDYPGQAHGNNWMGDWRVQIRVRGSPTVSSTSNPFQEAHKLADAVLGIVAPAGDQLVVVDLSGGRRASIRLATDLMPLGPDQSKGRYEFSINLALTSVRA